MNSSVSQGPVRGDKGSLHIDFPDKDRDGKKVTLHFSPAKVSYCCEPEPAPGVVNGRTIVVCTMYVHIL